MARNIIAILRGVTPNEVVDIGAALIECGITIIEVPLNSPDPFDSIDALVQRFADEALIGAGTVLTTDQVSDLAAIGGKLVVSPDTNPEVIAAAKQAGLTSYPGAMTPTECFAAIRAGADGLKLFPGELIGPQGLKAMKAVLPPHIPLFAVGGVNAGNFVQWHSAGATGYGIGSSLYAPGSPAHVVRARAAEIVAAHDAALSAK
jgi:2-dehydro-3-deoxyphosphogalactonate aldolase